MTREDFVNFITEKIKEEESDYNTYAKYAADTSYQAAASQMKQIAEEEKKHRDCLIKILAEMAKNGGTESVSEHPVK